jgi:hypothetical protein
VLLRGFGRIALPILAAFVLRDAKTGRHRRLCSAGGGKAAALKNW